MKWDEMCTSKQRGKEVYDTRKYLWDTHPQEDKAIMTMWKQMQNMCKYKHAKGYHHLQAINSKLLGNFIFEYLHSYRFQVSVLYM